MHLQTGAASPLAPNDPRGPRHSAGTHLWQRLVTWTPSCPPPRPLHHRASTVRARPMRLQVSSPA